MTYELATKTLRADTSCTNCGRLLVDSQSLEVGMGPTCRKRAGLVGDYPHREEVNVITRQANIDAQNGNVDAVFAVVPKLIAMGFDKVANILIKKFIDIRISYDAN